MVYILKFKLYKEVEVFIAMVTNPPSNFFGLLYKNETVLEGYRV